MTKAEVRKMLRALQHRCRVEYEEQPPEETFAHLTFRVPDDLATDEARQIYLRDEDVLLYEEVLEALDGCLEYEHLRDGDAKAALQRFIALATLQRSNDHVRWFEETHAREPETYDLFFGIRYLQVPSRFELGGARFFPPGDSEIPEGLSPEHRFEGVVSTTATGTNGKQIHRRARTRANYALQLLRVGMKAASFTPDMLLHFKLGDVYGFGPRWGFQRTTAATLELSGARLEIVRSQRFASVSFDSTSEVDRRARLALRSLERSITADDEAEATMWLVVTLETLLGDKRGELKSHRLAFRRAMLSVEVEGHFPDVSRLHAVYALVRSRLAHGEDPEDVPDRLLRQLHWDIRDAVNQYLQLSDARGFSRRIQLTRFLATHEQAPELLETLRQMDPETWHTFELSEASPDPPA